VLQTSVYLIATGQQLTPGRRADRLYVVVVQPHTTACQTIQSRRLDRRRAVVADVVISVVVGENKHDVWRRLCCK